MTFFVKYHEYVYKCGSHVLLLINLKLGLLETTKKAPELVRGFKDFRSLVLQSYVSKRVFELFRGQMGCRGKLLEHLRVF